jgi:hypothetical protein
MFVLTHLQALHTTVDPSMPLYVCLIDFVKAFDTVQRSVLWERVRRLGVASPFLDCLCAMYKHVRLRVKVSGKLGTVFDSILGVKQGDPLSPILFGAFIEVLPEFIQALNTISVDLYGSGVDLLDDCPSVQGFALFYLLFADDLTLITHNRAKLQALLSALEVFCTVFGLDVNTDKTEILILGNDMAVSAAKSGCVCYKGKPLKYVLTAKYLGVMFESNGTTLCAEQALCESARRASFALNQRIRDIRHLTPHTQLHLFDTLVRPILLYGSEIWGMNRLTLPRSTLNGRNYGSILPNNPLEQVVTDFLRFISRCGRTAPNWVLHQELCVQPLQAYIVRRMLNFWNRLRESPNSLAALVAKADIKLMLEGCKSCWTYKLIQFIARLDEHMCTTFMSVEHAEPFLCRSVFPEDAESYFWDLKFAPRQVADCVNRFWQRRMTSRFVGDPRSTHIYPKFHAYVDWVGLPIHPPAHLSTLIPWNERRSLMTFRVGAWCFIEVNKDRVSRLGHRRTRGQRHCPLCTMGRVEDEYHVLMECPYYDDVRSRHTALFPNRQDTPTTYRMRCILNHENQTEVASLVHCIATRRQACAQ